MLPRPGQRPHKGNAVIEKIRKIDAPTRGELKSAADRAGVAIQHMAHKIGDELSELGDQAQERGVRGTRYVRRKVKLQPLAAMAVIGAVGLLLGILLGRETRSGRYAGGFRIAARPFGPDGRRNLVRSITDWRQTR